MKQLEETLLVIGDLKTRISSRIPRPTATTSAVTSRQRAGLMPRPRRSWIFARCCLIQMSFCMWTKKPHVEQLLNRRDFLMRGGAGFGALALTYLLESERLLAATTTPSSARPPHFPAKAKSVIFLFMEGGPRHLDTFDPKPKVREMAGQKLPESFR